MDRSEDCPSKGGNVVVKVGDIVEQINGPYCIVNHHYPRVGSFGFTSYKPVEGPLTKRQHDYREYCRQNDERRDAAALVLRTRIHQRIESEIGARIIPGDTSKEAIKPLIDLIVDLIHEESEY